MKTTQALATASRNSAPATESAIDIDLDQVMTSLVGSGLQIRDRFHRLRRYRECFLGNEMVDWLQREKGIGRPEAIRIGRRLIALNTISHVEGEHDFKDQPLFYVIGRVNNEVALTDLSIQSVRSLLVQMRGQDGLQVGTRRRWLVNYPMSFSGAEVVDWICAQTGSSRQEANEVGTKMLGANMIRHVFDTRPFHDNAHLYRFV